MLIHICVYIDTKNESNHMAANHILIWYIEQSVPSEMHCIAAWRIEWASIGGIYLQLGSEGRSIKASHEDHSK